MLIATLLLAQMTFATAGKNVPPQRLVADLYYVGANEITSFLFVTPKGMILLDAGYPEMAPQVEHNIEALGFKLKDVKILLNSQAHFDHAGTLAQLKKDTGAKVYAIAAAARELRNGGPEGDTRYAKVETDVVVPDGGAIELGGTTLIAHWTPGHTKGCTTYTAKLDGKDAVFVCSASVVNPLVGNAHYPDIVADYRKTFPILRALPCDLFFAAHGSFFDLEHKLGTPARFVDPQGYRSYIDEAQAAFEHNLVEQSAQRGEKG